MDCREFESLISGYLDEELAQSRKEQFEVHRDNCPSCADLLEEFLSLDQLMAESAEVLPDEDYWPGFDARLKEKIEKAGAKKFQWSFGNLFRRSTLGWAAVTLLIIMVLVSPVLKEVLYPAIGTGIPTAPATREIISPRDEVALDALDGDDTDALKEKKEESPLNAETSPVNGSAVVGRVERDKPLAEVEKPAPAPVVIADSPEESFSGEVPGRLVEEESSLESEHKVMSPPSVGMRSGIDSRHLVEPAAPAPEVAPAPAPEAPMDDYVLPGEERLALRHRRADAIPDELMSDIFTESSPTPEGRSYLSRSEAVLIRMVNLREDSGDLRMLQTALKKSSFTSIISEDNTLFSKDPRLESHGRQMRELATELMKISPEKIDDFRDRVIRSGILQKTRELNI